MDIYIPFTYIIGWSKHKKFYYGAKYAQGCQPSDLWESYFTSSEYVKEFREENGEPDIIKIHRTFPDKDSCVLFEHEYLIKIDAKNNVLFLNKTNGGKGFGLFDENAKEKSKQTNLEKYGFEFANQSPIIQEKTKQTNLEKYGFEYSLMSPIIQEKSKQTNLEKYGFEFANQSPVVKEKKKQTCLEQYGYDNVNKIPEIKEKGKISKQERYGNKNYNNRDKAKQSWLQIYNVDNPSKNEEVKIKKKNTLQLNFGVDNPAESPIIREKQKQTCMEKYNVECGFHIQIICPFCNEIQPKSHIHQCKENPERNVYDRSGGKNPRAIKISINGIIYETLKEAQNKYNVKKIRKYLDNKTNNLPEGVYEAFYV